MQGHTIKIPDLMISTAITSLFLKGQILIYGELISVRKKYICKFWKKVLRLRGAIYTYYGCCLVEKE